ncbi:MAG TPA: HAD family hydrolase [Acidimicrobiia bacterium]|nr:HAD family hydrolase [Acidimicrobiia bacterium]
MVTIELVVTDLDGTLWSGHEEIHPRTRQAWTELERRGLPVLVATGRRVASTRLPLAAVGLAPPAVVMNGALALDLASGSRFHHHHCDPDIALRIVRAFRTAGLEPCVYVDHQDVEVIVTSRPATHPDHLASLESTATHDDLERVVTELPVFMFGMMGHADGLALREIAEQVGGFAEAHVARDQFGGHSLTAGPRGVSKWVGVEAYCARAGLDPSRVLALGDGPNDGELLDRCAIAVVPEDAHPGALTRADHVVPPADTGGWAGVLDLV